MLPARQQVGSSRSSDLDPQPQPQSDRSEEPTTSPQMTESERAARAQLHAERARARAEEARKLNEEVRRRLSERSRLSERETQPTGGTPCSTRRQARMGSEASRINELIREKTEWQRLRQRSKELEEEQMADASLGNRARMFTVQLRDHDSAGYVLKRTGAQHLCTALVRGGLDAYGREMTAAQSRVPRSIPSARNNECLAVVVPSLEA